RGRPSRADTATSALAVPACPAPRWPPPAGGDRRHSEVCGGRVCGTAQAPGGGMTLLSGRRTKAAPAPEASRRNAEGTSQAEVVTQQAAAVRYGRAEG